MVLITVNGEMHFINSMTAYKNTIDRAVTSGIVTESVEKLVKTRLSLEVLRVECLGWRGELNVLQYTSHSPSPSVGHVMPTRIEKTL